MILPANNIFSANSDPIRTPAKSYGDFNAGNISNPILGDENVDVEKATADLKANAYNILSTSETLYFHVVNSKTHLKFNILRRPNLGVSITVEVSPMCLR